MLFHIPRLAKNQGLPYFMDWPIFNRGIDAVYVFFVLSGFLIIGQIVDYKRENKFSIKRFYIRRALRILPLYYLIVIFGFIFYNVIVPFLGFDFAIQYNFLEGFLLTVFFLPNIFASLFDPGGILEILWSIGIEEQFYLLIAPSLYFIKNKRVLYFLCGILIAYFLFFHANITEYPIQFGMVYFFLFAGGIVGVLERKNKLQFLKKSSIIPYSIIVIFILYFFTDLFSFQVLWQKNLFLCIVFSLLVHSLAHNNGKLDIQNRLLNYFGKISYGIYMYHVIILNFVVFIYLKFLPYQSLPNWANIVLMNVLVTSITILVSHISYKYFENYFLKLKYKFRK